MNKTVPQDEKNHLMRRIQAAVRAFSTNLKADCTKLTIKKTFHIIKKTLEFADTWKKA